MLKKPLSSRRSKFSPDMKLSVQSIAFSSFQKLPKGAYERFSFQKCLGGYTPNHHNHRRVRPFRSDPYSPDVGFSRIINSITKISCVLACSIVCHV